MNIYDLSVFDSRSYEYNETAQREINRNVNSERVSQLATLILFAATIVLFIVYKNFWIIVGGVLLIIALRILRMRLYNGQMKRLMTGDRQTYHDYVYYLYSSSGKSGAAHLIEMMYANVLMEKYDLARDAAAVSNEIALNGYGQFKYYYCMAKLARLDGDEEKLVEYAKELYYVSEHVPMGPKQKELLAEFEDVDRGIKKKSIIRPLDEVDTTIEIPEEIDWSSFEEKDEDEAQ